MHNSQECVAKGVKCVFCTALTEFASLPTGVIPGPKDPCVVDTISTDTD